MSKASAQATRQPVSIDDFVESKDDEYLNRMLRRFKDKVDFTGPSGCWLWTGSLRDYRYGELSISENGKPRSISAHRFSMYVAKGFTSIQHSQVNHKCDNTKCVNPTHLYLGDVEENVQDAIDAGTHVSLKTQRLSEDEVLSIRQEYAEGGVSHRELGEKYSVSATTIGDIVRGETWQSVDGPRTTSQSENRDS